MTFRAHDTFVGQIAWLSPKEFSSRQETIADLQLIHDRVWLAPVLPDGSIGQLVEQTLTYSAIKSTDHIFLGKIWYQQRGFATQLPPGEYVSIWEGSYAGDPPEVERATVHIIITP